MSASTSIAPGTSNITGATNFTDYGWLDICVVGSTKGYIAPIGGDAERMWNPYLLAVLYALGLCWCFLGVNIIADIFMLAIEKITSIDRIVTRKDGTKVRIRTWNDTVANLTLMAMGSSAPEILLNVTEICGAGFFSGDLGPSTVVGSAAFNLLVINAFCTFAIVVGEVRRVDQIGVYALTSTCSILAYVWLVLILVVISPDVVETWEAAVTFAGFPLLVVFAYVVDRKHCHCCVKVEEAATSLDNQDIGVIKSIASTATVGHNSDKKTQLEAVRAILTEVRSQSNNVPKKVAVQIALQEIAQLKAPKSIAYHRVTGARKMAGMSSLQVVPEGQGHEGGVLSEGEAKHEELIALLEAEGALDDNTEGETVVRHNFHFATKEYAVLESTGKLSVVVCRPATVSANCVRIRTREGTAKEVEDFTPVDTVLMFGPDQSKMLFTVDITVDNVYETDEDFFLDLLPHNPTEGDSAGDNGVKSTNSDSNDTGSSSGNNNGDTKRGLADTKASEADVDGSAKYHNGRRFSSDGTPLPVGDPLRPTDSPVPAVGRHRHTASDADADSVSINLGSALGSAAAPSGSDSGTDLNAGASGALSAKATTTATAEEVDAENADRHFESKSKALDSTHLSDVVDGEAYGDPSPVASPEGAGQRSSVGGAGTGTPPKTETQNDSQGTTGSDCKVSTKAGTLTPIPNEKKKKMITLNTGSRSSAKVSPMISPTESKTHGPGTRSPKMKLDGSDTREQAPAKEKEEVQVEVVNVDDPQQVQMQQQPAQVQRGDTMLQRRRPLDTAHIYVIDDSAPGILEFSTEHYQCCESEKKVTITVNRRQGGKGAVSCKVKTVDREAVSPEDYAGIDEEDPMLLEFADGELSKSFDIAIVDDQVYEKDESFDVVLFDPQGGASLKDTGYTVEELFANVNIISDEKERKIVDKMAQAFAINYGRVRIGSQKYSQQFVDAVFPGGNRNCKAKPGECVLHIFSLPWRLLFAIIPPVDVAGGWITFFLSLVGIAGATMIMADMAGLLGCVLGFPPSFTAISLVAIGTSIPDLFASMNAARADEYADASIGNVMGSNSVNVFMGLGLPWFLAAIYWDYFAEDEELRVWITRYKDIDNAEVQSRIQDVIDGKTEHGFFIVPAQDLGFSVTVFCSVALLCLLTFGLRRKFAGGELGGPVASKVVAGSFMIFLWLSYVTISGLQAFGVIQYDW